MRRPTAAIGSAVFFVLAPGMVVGLIHPPSPAGSAWTTKPTSAVPAWWPRQRPWDPAERDEPGAA
jgi:hypothetical protein